MNLPALLLVLALGALAGYLLRPFPRVIAFNRGATQYALSALLLCMGTRLAQGRAMLAQDLGLLLSAAGSALLLVALYFLVFYLAGRLWRRRGARREERPEQGPGTHPFAAALWNGGWIAAGWILFLLLPSHLTRALPLDALSTWILRALLLVIGFDLGAEIHHLSLGRLPPLLLLIPLVNIALTLACALLFSALRGIPPRQALLLYSGLGWYSLSSVLINQHGLALMALLAFIHNVFRELLSILTAPLAARVSPYLPIYLGGATSMDVMLPFVQRYSGPAYTLPSFYSGLICSLMVLPLVRGLLG